MPKQSSAPQYVKESSINEFEVIRFQVLEPTNGRWFYNGYLKGRVRPGEETEIPRWHPVRDKGTQRQVEDESGEKLYRENKVPQGCTFIGFEDRTPRRPSSAPAKAGGTTSTKPKMRAADAPVGV